MLSHDQAAGVAAAILEIRRIRMQILPGELFGEPAWDLLLELFVADAEGVRLTGMDVSQRRDIRPAIVSRWLVVLSEHGLIVGDGSGDLGEDITLSASALSSMEEVLERISARHDTLSG